MKNLLLILLLLFIQPVSNEQIQQNIGFQQPQIVEYQQTQYSQFKGPAKAPWRDDYYTVTATNGQVFTVVYRTIIGDYGIIVRNDGGLGLSSWYSSVSELQQAIQKAIEEYNHSVPIGDPIICLLLFGSLYLTYVWYKQRRLGKIDSRGLD